MSGKVGNVNEMRLEHLASSLKQSFAKSMLWFKVPERPERFL
jgi:hypothetical protein